MKRPQPGMGREGGMGAASQREQQERVATLLIYWIVTVTGVPIFLKRNWTVTSSGQPVRGWNCLFVVAVRGCTMRRTNRTYAGLYVR